MLKLSGLTIKRTNVLIMSNCPDIDFVLIWVDGSDEKWREEKEQYSSQEIKHFNSNDVRYRDWGLLKYWFRSVEINAPWVRRIHFVTCGHYPEWLNIEHEKLHFVKHDNYIPKEYLPTFSSHPIELNLHRIEGLSEQFVYFNDDMFVNSPIRPNDFFIRGIPRDCAIRSIPIVSRFGLIDMNSLIIINRSFSFPKQFKKYPFKWLNLKYGVDLFRSLLLLPWPVFCGIKNTHIPNAFLKTTFEKVWNKYPEELSQTCSRRFRDERDVNQYVFRYWQIAEGNFIPRSNTFGHKYVLSDKQINAVVEDIRRAKHHMICLNDEDSLKDIDVIKDKLVEVFERRYPDKSSFEL